MWVRRIVIAQPLACFDMNLQKDHPARMLVWYSILSSFCTSPYTPLYTPATCVGLPFFLPPCSSLARALSLTILIKNPLRRRVNVLRPRWQFRLLLLQILRPPMLRLTPPTGWQTLLTRDTLLMLLADILFSATSRITVLLVSLLTLGA